MKDFDYERPASVEQAVDLVTKNPSAQYLAGGSNLLDHLKLGITAPDLLVDVTGLGLDRIEQTPDGGLRIGANVLNADLAADRWVLRHQPVLARALLAGASGQIRNQATTAGNLLQRTRCVYFQDRTTACNKREPGSGCSADSPQAHTRDNAVLGSSPACRAVHPGDMPVALAALDARVVVRGADGERSLGLDDFYRLPGEDASRETVLRHGELVTHVVLPAPVEGAAQGYHKVRDRASFAFALVSVAAVLRMREGVVDELRLAWGGVAHRPWRARGVEQALRGGCLDEASIREACALEFAQAHLVEGTRAKPAMVAGATAMVLLQLAEQQPGPSEQQEAK